MKNTRHGAKSEPPIKGGLAARVIDRRVRGDFGLELGSMIEQVPEAEAGADDYQQRQKRNDSGKSLMTRAYSCHPCSLSRCDANRVGSIVLDHSRFAAWRGESSHCSCGQPVPV